MPMLKNSTYFFLFDTLSEPELLMFDVDQTLSSDLFDVLDCISFEPEEQTLSSIFSYIEDSGSECS
ncbi:MAG: hypothetical protein GX879_10625 [Bacteroidales bacterium]|nr:hypothetical protein [Bacteroidales bacterium]